MRSNRTKLLFILISFISLALFLITCQKEKLATREFPRLGTLEVTDISDAGAIFNGEIISLGNNEIVDHGFVWSATDPQPRLGVSDKISLGPQGISGPYSAEITTTLMASENYTVRAYAVTSKDQAVYGQVIEFFSLGSEAPTISEIIPLTGTWHDTILIKGSNFSNLAHSNTVLLDTVEAIVVSATDSLLEVRVPLKLLKINSSISVSIAGNKVHFNEEFGLLPPDIAEIIPESGFYKDTLTILGEYFYPHTLLQNELKIDGVSCKVISSSSKLIKVLVPPELTEGQKSVSIGIIGQEFTKENSFYSSAPKIQTFFPTSGTYLDTVTITGINFHSERMNKFLTIGDIVVTPDFYNDSTIKIKVPIDLGKNYSSIILKIDDLTFSPNQEFELLEPEITKIMPDYGTYGDTIAIIGNFFNPEITKNQVRIDGTDVNILSSSINQITVQIPYSFIPEADYSEVIVNIGELFSSENTTIQIPYPWRQVADYPSETQQCRCFTIKDKAYVGFNLSKSLWEYNPLTNNWNELANYPGSDYYVPRGGFSVKDTGYVYSPSNLYAYYPESNTWEQKISQPVFSQGAISFVIQDFAYVGLGRNNPAFWRYDSASNEWVRMADFPENGSGWGVGFSVLNKGYVYSSVSGNFYEYDPQKDEWSAKSSLQGESREFPIGYGIGEKGYIGIGNNNEKIFSDFYEFDPGLNQWKRMANLPISVAVAFGFSIEGKGYLGGGMEEIENYSYVNHKVYEFDPTK